MENTIEFIKNKTDIKPEIAMILGSGLGVIADSIEGVRIPFEEIPGFLASKVEGHAGQLVIGKLQEKNVIAMQGRFHFYEGHSMQQVTFPVKVMKKLGVEKLIVTNAAGGVNKSFNPGDLMIIKDHINFMGTNPLIGPNDNMGERFPDMSNAYNKELRALARKTATELGQKIQEGTYVACTGPSYETPAEINGFRTLGADAVGMSTVPEVIVANHCGLRVLGISCITNMAAGVLDQPLNHQEVIETSAKVQKDFIALVNGILKVI